MPERHLILGGARSGKTNHAITLAASRAAARGERVVYVATAQALASLGPAPGMRIHDLGALALRGRVEPIHAFCVELSDIQVSGG